MLCASLLGASPYIVPPMPPRRVLFIGDIVGEPGRTALTTTLPSLVERYEPTIVIANGENVAGGLGITKRTAEKLFDAGIDVLTTGNHVYRHRDVYTFLTSPAASCARRTTSTRTRRGTR